MNNYNMNDQWGVKLVRFSLRFSGEIVKKKQFVEIEVLLNFSSLVDSICFDKKLIYLFIAATTQLTI